MEKCSTLTAEKKGFHGDAEQSRHGQLPTANLPGREQGFHDDATTPPWPAATSKPSTQLLVVVSSTPPSVCDTADCLWRPLHSEYTSRLSIKQPHNQCVCTIFIDKTCTRRKAGATRITQGRVRGLELQPSHGTRCLRWQTPELAGLSRRGAGNELSDQLSKSSKHVGVLHAHCGERAPTFAAHSVVSLSLHMPS